MKTIASALAAMGRRVPLALEPAPGNAPLVYRRARTNVAMPARAWALFGLLVTGVGMGMIAAATGIIDAPLVEGQSAPGWYVGGIGVFLSLAGITALLRGLHEARRMATMRRLRTLHPSEPWVWDYGWDHGGAIDRTPGTAEALAHAGLMLLVFAPLYWIGFFHSDGPIEIRLGSLIVGVATLAQLARAGNLYRRHMKYGSARASFERFPFRPGTTLEVHIEAPKSLPQHALATATLRCIEERYASRGLRIAMCFEIYRDHAAAELVGGSSRRAFRVRFDLPGDVPTTELSVRPCRYWELELEAPTGGVDYHARFLVPVY